MKRHSLLVAAFSTLVALPACGPGVAGGSESDSEGGTDSAGSTTDPVPLGCASEQGMIEHGQEFETEDGCVTFACDNGGLVPVVDNRVTVAGDLELSTQEVVDQQTCLFTVEGNLLITGSVADLTPLSRLNRVDGNLDISNTEAVTLDGLHALGEVGADITIADNANLTGMAFQPFMSVFGGVTIQNNDALVSLAGAEFIGQCGWCTTSETGVPGPDGSENGAQPLPEPGPGGDGGVDASAEGGADEPQGGIFYGAILIADNDLLSDLSALGNLYFAWDSVRFRNNDSLVDLQAVPLSEVQGDLEISGHDSMETVNAETFAEGILVSGATMICGNLEGLACE